jgi:PKD repeat protein
VIFDFAPTSPLAGQEVQFTPQANDPEGDAISYAWDFGDGATDTATAPRHAYDQAGTYTIGVTATDSHGASSTDVRQIDVKSDSGPTASFDVSPGVPDVGERVRFTSTSQASQGSIVDLRWDLDGDGAFDDFRGTLARWVFGSPGQHTVRLRAQQSNGKWAVREKSVRVNGLPSADFTWSPASPVAGGSVDLISTSTDFEGALAAFSWDLDGDGLFGDASQAQIRQPFPAPGTYDIGLRVTDSDGSVSTLRKQVVVLAESPAGPGTPPGGGGPNPSPAPRRPLLMNPFPIVRIAGTVLPGGARIRILSVRAPRGSRVRVRCTGKGCPVGSLATTSATRVVRFHRFERVLRAGIRLKVFVRKTNRIGKYTSFLIRAGAPPKRVDMCLFPSRRRPGRCP